MNNKGFTLMGQIVAIGLAILGMGIVAPMLLSHFADGKTAALGETLNNTQTAFQSYYVDQEGLISVDGTSGEYFADLVAKGFMSRVPTDAAITYTIELDDDSTAYYVEGDYASGSVDSVEARIADLDAKIDKLADGTASGADSGILQWIPGTQGTTAGEFFFLLYGESIDVSTADWRPAAID